jgi:Ca-activated chloride channel family protein
MLMKSNLLAFLIALMLCVAGLMLPPRMWANHPQSTASSGTKAEFQDPKPTGQAGRQQAPADEAETLKVETALVTIPVSVLDKDGRYAQRLTKSDFQIYEDGVEQEIEDLSTTEVPFNVVLLLDTSRSTVFRVEDIQRAAVAFVDELRRDDRVMVVSFDKEVYVDSEFTSDRNRLRSAIYGTRTGGETRLYDAVDLVITERLSRIQGRKAVVLFTDGVDTASRLASDRSTIARVEESGVLVYPIQYKTEGNAGGPFGRGRGGGQPPVFNPPTIPRFPRNGGGRRWPFESPVNNQFPRGGRREDYGRASKYLRDLSERSGARLYHAETIGSVSQAFSQIAEELRQQYALSYYPTNTAQDGAYRRIRVRVNQPNLAVRAREGYRASGKGQAQNSGGKQ